MVEKPVSLVEKKQEQSDDLLESLFEHIETIESIKSNFNG